MTPTPQMQSEDFPDDAGMAERALIAALEDPALEPSRNVLDAIARFSLMRIKGLDRKPKRRIRVRSYLGGHRWRR